MSFIKDLKIALSNALDNLKTKEGFKVYSPSELNISEFVIGGKVELIKADGTLETAPDGQYEMETGEKFTVKEGMIDSIEGVETPEPVAEVAAEEAPQEEVAVEEDSASEMDELKAEVAALKEQVAALIAAQESFKSVATKEDVEAFKSEVVKLNETISKLANIPAEFSKTSKSNTVKEKNEDKLYSFISAMNSK